VTTSIQWETEAESLDETTGDLVVARATRVLEFDCVTRETHDASAFLTEQTVERGAPIADHKRPEATRLSIEAWVTNTPLGAPPESGGRGTAVQTRISDGVLTFEQSFDRVADVHAAVRELVRDPVLVTVTTALEVYEEMTVIAVSEIREAANGAAQVFTIDLVSVRVAETQTVDAPTPREPRGQARRDRGSQEAADAANGDARNQSLLARAQDAASEGELGDFLGSLVGLQ